MTLLQHVQGHLMTRAKSLDTPLLISIVGPQDAAKDTAAGVCDDDSCAV